MKKNNVHFPDNSFKTFTNWIKMKGLHLLATWAGVELYTKAMIAWIFLFGGFHAFVGYSICNEYGLIVEVSGTVAAGLCGAFAAIIIWFFVAIVTAILINTVFWVCIEFLRPLGDRHPINQKLWYFRHRFIGYH